MTFMQEVVYDCIKKYIAEKGEAPSFRKLAIMAGLSSPATIHKHVHNLKRLGYIEIESHKTKSIKIKK